MTCPNCDVTHAGALIKMDKKGCCIECGKYLNGSLDSLKRWDKYFLTICNAVAAKSPCLSRQIGSIIVRDHSIVSTGYNGPARGYPHCKGIVCPRHEKGYHSGEGLHECPAAHAERNAIANAAKLGVCINKCTLYLNTQFPCKDCMTSIVNSGITEVVALISSAYDDIGMQIAGYGEVYLRKFLV